jgi:branched-chain amino acid transport system ATP-binding protein
MLNIENLNCSYGNVRVLWDVCLSVEEGEIVALLGANSAGKTTLLNAVTGVITPTSGEVTFMGESIAGLPPSRIVERGIAYLPEGGRLFPDMTIRENLEMGAYARGKWKNRRVMYDRVCEMFPILKEREKQLARTMSGGEQQMLAMARGLMSDPKLCMFDELSYGLAPIMVQEVFRIVKMLSERGITVLLVEQNVHQSLEIASRAYVLENGRVALSGDSGTLLGDDYIKKAYLGM